MVELDNIHKVDPSVEYKYMAGSTINPYTALLALDYIEATMKKYPGPHHAII